jgi:hypothetical protein
MGREPRATLLLSRGQRVASARRRLRLELDIPASTLDPPILV